MPFPVSASSCRFVPSEKIKVVAQKRFCGAEGIDKVENISDYLGNSFGEAYGILIKDKGLLARAIFVADKDNTLKHVEYVSEISEEPNYDTALSVIKDLL